jgi:hypothetical protein
VTPAALAALIPIPGRCAKSYSAPRCWDTRLLRYGSPHYQTDAQLFQPSGYDCVGEVNSDVRRQLNRFERSGRPSPLNLRDTLIDVWKTNNRVTVFLVEHLPAELWEVTVPGAPRRTIRMLAGHIHNAPDCDACPPIGISPAAGGHWGPLAVVEACPGSLELWFCCAQRLVGPEREERVFMIRHLRRCEDWRHHASVWTFSVTAFMGFPCLKKIAGSVPCDYWPCKRSI